MLPIAKAFLPRPDVIYDSGTLHLIRLFIVLLLLQLLLHLLLLLLLQVSGQIVFPTSEQVPSELFQLAELAVGRPRRLCLLGLDQESLLLERLLQLFPLNRSTRLSLSSVQGRSGLLMLLTCRRRLLCLLLLHNCRIIQELGQMLWRRRTDLWESHRRRG